jgi:hypothetical protein
MHVAIDPTISREESCMQLNDGFEATSRMYERTLCSAYARKVRRCVPYEHPVRTTYQSVNVWTSVATARDPFTYKRLPVRFFIGFSLGNTSVRQHM